MGRGGAAKGWSEASDRLRPSLRYERANVSNMTGIGRRWLFGGHAVAT
jgi:hypothetical protein